MFLSVSKRSENDPFLCHFSHFGSFWPKTVIFMSKLRFSTPKMRFWGSKSSKMADFGSQNGQKWGFWPFSRFWPFFGKVPFLAKKCQNGSFLTLFWMKSVKSAKKKTPVPRGAFFAKKGSKNEPLF